MSCIANQLRNCSELIILFSRNYRQTCHQLSGLDLSAWVAEEEPEFTTESADLESEAVAPSVEELNEDIIEAAVQKAKMSLNERNRFEYEAWLARKYLNRNN